MTDDDEGDLLEVQGRLRIAETRLDGMEDVAGAVNDKLDELLAEQAAAPANFHWPDLTPEDRQVRWTAFLGWVQEVLCARYPRAREALRACWWEHDDVVDAVTACWFTWLHAYRNGQAAGTDAGNWQRTYLPEMVKQAGEALTSCSRGHEPDAPLMEALKTVPVDLS